MSDTNRNRNQATIPADTLEVQPVVETAPVRQAPQVHVKYVGKTACNFTSNKVDYHLSPGETYYLPVCPFVESLQAQQLLVPADV